MTVYRRMSTCSASARSRAVRSGRTAKPMMIADEADANGEAGLVSPDQEMRIPLPGTRKVITPKTEGQRRYLESLNAYARQFVQPAARAMSSMRVSSTPRSA